METLFTVLGYVDAIADKYGLAAALMGCLAAVFSFFYLVVCAALLTFKVDTLAKKSDIRRVRRDGNPVFVELRQDSQRSNQAHRAG